MPHCVRSASAMSFQKYRKAQDDAVRLAVFLRGAIPASMHHGDHGEGYLHLQFTVMVRP